MNKYKELKISSEFGMRNNPFTDKKEFHVGIDFLPDNTNQVWAGFSGVINRVTYGNREGNYIQIKSKINQVIMYINLFHLEKAADFIKKGIFVRPDDVIGIMGNSGNSTGTHCHYEIWTYNTGAKFSKTLRCNIRSYTSREPKPRLYFNAMQLFNYCKGSDIYV